ncbi:MAG: diacylglycerol kinase family protein [Acidimicrobiia bacterium]|nr:MAG: diacylglycerol kinase family protein [Acidimicrobiia bacterium]
MRSMLLIANPAASGFNSSTHREVVGILGEAFRVTSVWPDGPEAAEETATRAAGEGVEVVAAMGGDGIVHRVANALHGSSAVMAVIPAGTTNVFARLTGHPRSARKTARVLAGSNRIRLLPVARLHAVAGSGSFDRIAVFAAGVGFDAEVIAESDRRPLKKVGAGAWHYASSALRTARRFSRRRPELLATVDGETVEAVTLIAQVGERFTYLGRRSLSLHPAGGPSALAVQRVDPLRLLRVIAATGLRRSPDGIAGVNTWHPISSIEVVAQGPVAFEADGETFGRVDRLSLEMVPDGLSLLDPSESGADRD